MEAQIAANGVGAKRIGELIERRGADAVRCDFEAVQDYAERLMRTAISGVPDGSYSYADVLEGDGISNRQYKIEVTATVRDSEIDFDFSRSDKAARGPINCGVASVAACVYYVAKALAGADIPANAGAFRPFHVKVRPGTILSPKFPAAVCNANIVTTQRIVDVILGALAQAFPDRVGAASSGSMHLINIGIQHRDRYLTLVETFAGGQGGLPGQDGMHAVHSHMTNTRNTPVEILENEYPITIEEYSLVEGSAGLGRWRGGAGIRRRYLLNAPAVVTLSSDRATVPPWGLQGGAPGRTADNYRLARNGRRVRLASKSSFRMAAGERLVIETPGGGGFGDPAARAEEAEAGDLRSGVVSAGGRPRRAASKNGHESGTASRAVR
jgi:N-methylhydantoinase B